MRVSTVLSAIVASVFVGFAAAQTISTCVLICSAQAATVAGCSSYVDASCVCTSAPFQNAAGACLKANCTTADQQSAVQLQSALCGNLTVTSGTVTATLASATASTSINSGALSSSVSASSASASSTMSSSMMMSSSMASSAASSASASASGVLASASSVSAAASSAAATTSKSAASKVEFGIGKLAGTGVAVVGVLVGAVMTL